MSRLATDARFGQGTTGGTWYDPPYPQTIEQVNAQWPQFAQRAAWLHTRFPTGKIGVAGTGLAWTQFFLFSNHTRQSWGCDIDWATTKAKLNLGAWANFVMSADVTVASQMTNFRRLGNAGQAKYEVLFTEDLLPCANSDTEAQTMLTNLRAVGTTLVHLITPAPSNPTTADMLWKTPAEWRTLIGPTDIIVLPDLTEVP